MAEGVIDLLEIVEVDEEHGAARARLDVTSQRPSNEVMEVAAVGESGERVMVRLVLHLTLAGCEAHQQRRVGTESEGYFPPESSREEYLFNNLCTSSLAMESDLPFAN